MDKTRRKGDGDMGRSHPPSRRMTPGWAPQFSSAQKVEVDIHHMTCEQAKAHLERVLSRLDGSVREVTVIHGYTGGTVLQEMVRNRLKHPRIRSKVVGLNQGVTLLILR